VWILTRKNEEGESLTGGDDPESPKKWAARAVFISGDPFGGGPCLFFGKRSSFHWTSIASFWEALQFSLDFRCEFLFCTSFAAELGRSIIDGEPLEDNPRFPAIDSRHPGKSPGMSSTYRRGRLTVEEMDLR
jgi:hypothetical protein